MTRTKLYTADELEQLANRRFGASVSAQEFADLGDEDDITCVDVPPYEVEFLDESLVLEELLAVG